LPVFDPLATIAISISIAIGHFSVFYLLFDEKFVKRYKQFNADLENWKVREVKEFNEKLQARLGEQESYENLVAFTNSWADRQMIIGEITKGYDKLRNSFKWIHGSFLVAILCSGFSFLYPGVLNPGAQGPLYWADIGAFLMFVGILLVFRYILYFHDLSSKVAKFEMGTPIEKVFETELTKTRVERRIL